MANSWFQFKHFRVVQERSALKVGTDACILGAWAHKDAPARILDIGTGTGLLALMLAQRYDAPIHALEPDQEALIQAQENFNNSPWKESIEVFPTRLQQFVPGYVYSLIVCNPPFYADHLKSPNKRRNQALHQETLTFKELAANSKRLLAGDGLLFVLLPPRQMEDFERTAKECDLHVHKRLLVQDRPHLPIHRCVYSFSNTPVTGAATEYLIIREATGAYTSDYRKLMEAYYLIF